MAKNGQKWPKITKNDFFDFQSVYTQNDRNFALILNLSLIFEKKGQNGQKTARKDQKSPKMIFLTFKVFILKMTTISP